MESNAPQHVPDLFNYNKDFKTASKVLDDEKKKKYEKLSSVVNQELAAEFDAPYAEKYNEATLLRYLKANNWKEDVAFDRMKKTLKWRKEFEIHKLKPSDFLVEGAKGKAFVSGFDNENRPIIIMDPSKRTTEDWDMHVKIIVFSTEVAIKLLPPGVEKVSLIVDLREYSSKYRNPFSVSKQVLDILSTHYPERLGRCIIIDAPWIFSSLYKCLSPFLDPVTKQKIIFSSLNTKNQSHISEFIPDQYLFKMYGGNRDFVFNPDIYCESLSPIFDSTN